MRNLDIKDTIQKIKKNKSEIKKELEEESITSGKRNENTNMQEKVKPVQQMKKMTSYD